MRRILFSFLIGFLFLGSNSSFGQKFFSHLHLGYGISASKDVLGSKAIDTISTNIMGTQGRGAVGAVGFGYMIKDYIGVEISFMSLITPRILQTHSEQSSKNSLATLHYYHRIYSAVPAVVLRTNGEKIQFYSRLGAVIPLTGATFAERIALKDTDLDGTRESEEKVLAKIRGEFSVGFKGAIGIEIPLKEWMGLTFEIETIALRIISKDSKTLEWTSTVNGETTDLLPEKSIAETELIFQEEINTSTDNWLGVEQDRPLQTLHYTSNYNRAGINVGLNFKF